MFSSAKFSLPVKGPNKLILERHHTRVNRKFKSKMFGALRGSAWRTQSVVKNSVSRQITKNFGDDVQVGRPINAWGPQAMWVCTARISSTNESDVFLACLKILIFYISGTFFVCFELLTSQKE